MKIATPQQMRELDRAAIEDRGIPGRVLMARAGAAAAAAAKELLSPAVPDPLVVILAGKGNNGGDGLVAARLLGDAGIRTRTFLLARGRELKGDAALNLVRLLKKRYPLIEVRGEEGLPGLESALADAAVIVDGIFGTGFQGPARGLSARVIGLANHASRRLDPPRVLAIDIPSGLDGESGRKEGEAIRADRTVTMGLIKTGMVRGEGLNLCGRITTAGLGFPADLAAGLESELESIAAGELSALLKPRPPSSHKGDYGRLLIIAGSPGMTGAAALAARAALRAGTGLVTVGVPRSLNPILEGMVAEAMTLPLPETAEGTLSPGALGPILEFCRKVDGAALGPGLSRNRATGRLVRQLVRKSPVPLLVDADGLNLIARRRRILKKSRSPLILTPHSGEMSRLSGLSGEELLADREGAARRFAKEYDLTLVLKGAGTLIAAPSGPLWINLTGNPGMATGGSGDILTGLIAGFRAQGLEAADAARLGVFVHGAAGDLAALRRGMMSMLPSDLLEEIPAVLSRLFPRNLPPAA